MAPVPFESVVHKQTFSEVELVCARVWLSVASLLLLCFDAHPPSVVVAGGVARGLVIGEEA